MEVPYQLSEPELTRLRAGIRIMALQRMGDAELAEEIAQESLARVVQAVQQNRLREPERVGGFARAIAHNVLVDALRQRQRTVSLGPAESMPARTEDALQ